MEYLLTFLEGFISFISPCMLPMVPVYISYFAGSNEKTKKISPLLNAVFFVLGFTLVFTLLGLFAGAAGNFLSNYRTALNIICGSVIIFFGLKYLGVFKIGFFKGLKKAAVSKGLLSSFTFGIVFSVSLTPCVGTFLGAALMFAAQQQAAFKGTLLLISYSLGLGIPFILSALLTDRLKYTFVFFKKHYRIINTISGLFLIIIGILMMFGLLNVFFSIFGG